MIDYVELAADILRKVANGELTARVVHDVIIEPVFAVDQTYCRSATFCVFDDAGDLDYIAWFAIGQKVLVTYPGGRDGDKDPLDLLTREEDDALGRILWSLRDRH